MSKVTGSEAAAWSPRAASIAIGSTAIALIALLALHIVSPEFDPSWRAVSEYANGKHGWLLSLFFATWAMGTESWTLAAWTFFLIQALFPWIPCVTGPRQSEAPPDDRFEAARSMAQAALERLATKH